MEPETLVILRDLFSHCSHQEQLTLLQELPKFLCRDFIVLLPLDVVPLILEYLEPAHVITSCMMVRIKLTLSLLNISP